MAGPTVPVRAPLRFGGDLRAVVPLGDPGPALPGASGGALVKSPRGDKPGPSGDYDGRSLDRRRPPLVLLVDDLEDQRELYREYLRFAGYAVIVARDGFEGIDRALRDRPDVVVMDLAMPALDGFEATERLKVLERTRGIPVIALTAHGELPREWALRAGCAAYLRKPCYPNDLAAAIDEVLSAEAKPRPVPSAPDTLPGRPQVLLVDGSVGDRELFAEYLEYRGCAVSVTVDPQQAFGDAKRLRPALIVLDLDSPKVNGWAFLERLRQDPALRDVAVVGLSRKAVGAARARSLSATFLIKPCEPDAVYREVVRVMAGRRPH